MEEVNSLTLPYQCEVCGEDFSTKFRLDKHKVFHRKCKKCGEAYDAYISSNSPNSISNFISAENTCELCCKQYIHSSAMTQYTQSGKAYQCKFCAKSFSRLCFFKNHLNLHTAKKSYDCDVCGKKYLHYNTLRAHKQNNHSKVNQVYGRMFNAIKTLKDHKRADKKKADQKKAKNAKGNDKMEDHEKEDQEIEDREIEDHEIADREIEDREKDT